MLGSNFYPSEIENQIYEMMDNHILGIDLYEEDLTEEIIDYFTNYYPAEEWNLACSEWPDCSGGACYVSWIENGHIHMIGFDYKKEGAVL